MTLRSITSWDSYASATRRADVVFRGQTSHYPALIPSFFRRPVSANYQALERAAARLYLQAYRAQENQKMYRDEGSLEFYEDELGPYGTPPLPFPGHGFGSLSVYDEYGPMIDNFTGANGNHRFAVLQHYGAPTPALDVSFDPGVALWFATHDFRSDSSGVARYYPRDGCGFVYLISAPRTSLVDLRGGRLVPDAGLRGQRQKGALLLGATSANPDLAGHIVEVLEINSSIWRSAPKDVTVLSQRQLFPPPEEDVFFDTLLNARLSIDPDERELAGWFTVYV